MFIYVYVYRYDNNVLILYLGCPYPYSIRTTTILVRYAQYVSQEYRLRLVYNTILRFFSLPRKADLM